MQVYFFSNLNDKKSEKRNKNKEEERYRENR